MRGQFIYIKNYRKKSYIIIKNHRLPYNFTLKEGNIYIMKYAIDFNILNDINDNVYHIQTKITLFQLYANFPIILCKRNMSFDIFFSFVIHLIHLYMFMGNIQKNALYSHFYTTIYMRTT
jgi:hypothetical protein